MLYSRIRYMCDVIISHHSTVPGLFEALELKDIQMRLEQPLACHEKKKNIFHSRKY